FRLKISAVVISGKIAFEGALVGVEHQSALNMTFSVCPLWMYPKPILLESLNVGGVGKFVIVVIGTEAFECRGKVEDKRGGKMMPDFGQNVLPAKTVIVKSGIRIIVKCSRETLGRDVAARYHVRPASSGTAQGHILFIGLIRTDACP